MGCALNTPSVSETVQRVEWFATILVKRPGSPPVSPHTWYS
jgi:hypothetical protein